MKRPSMMNMPTFSYGGSNYKDNQNAPRVRFIRKNGRVIPIVGQKKSVKASEALSARLNEMKSEVLSSSSEGYSFKDTNRGVKYTKAFSTFPSFYREIKFKNKGEFLSAYSGKGKKADDLVEQAHEDLSKGYRSSRVGDVPANMNYRVATKQSFDNTNVIFRKVNGRIVPIRTKAKKDRKVSFDPDDVPF